MLLLVSLLCVYCKEGSRFLFLIICEVSNCFMTFIVKCIVYWLLRKYGLYVGFNATHYLAGPRKPTWWYYPYFWMRWTFYCMESHCICQRQIIVGEVLLSPDALDGKLGSMKSTLLSNLIKERERVQT